MAYQISGSVIIDDNRVLLGVSTAGISTLYVSSETTAENLVVNGTVSGSAGIVTSAALDDATIIRTTGVTTFSADQSMGGFKLTNLGSPTVNADSATKEYVDTATAGQGAFWTPARVEADTAITLSGIQTVDGVTLADGDRVLVNAQADDTTNGIYDVNDSGAWSRSTDANESGEFLLNKTVFIEEGGTHSGNVWAYSGDSNPTLGADSITFIMKSSAAQIADGSITTPKLADLAVTDAKVNDVAATKLTGTLNDATVAESNVTQHEAALAITESQITDYDPATAIAGNHIAPSSVSTGIVTATELDLNGTADISGLLTLGGGSSVGSGLTITNNIWCNTSIVADTGLLVGEGLGDGGGYLLAVSSGGFNVEKAISVTGDVNVSSATTTNILDVTATSSFGAGATFSGDINANGNIVGDTDTNISGINSVTASSFYGDGSALTNLPSAGSADAVLVSDNQDNTDYPMIFASAVGAGASIYSDSTTNFEFTYNPSTGTATAATFDSVSDARLKENIREIEDATAKLAGLRGVEFDWKGIAGSSVGVLAQEVQNVYPQLVTEHTDRLTVNYDGLVGLLLRAVKELTARVEELEKHH